jgi:uncharacterized membrane protein YoaK (UPF0700 family)
MTGALVRMGHRIAMALRGGPKWDFLPFLMLWVSLTTGAILGALTFNHFGEVGLWVAASVALTLTAVVTISDRRA